MGQRAGAGIVITLWTWKQSEVKSLKEKVETSGRVTWARFSEPTLPHRWSCCTN